jgi:uncharacterized membrane protein SpoIIM required for sporulation
MYCVDYQSWLASMTFTQWSILLALLMNGFLIGFVIRDRVRKDKDK